MNLNNKGNEYQRLLKDFDKMPKTVLAAIAVSFALRQVDEDFDKAEAEVKNEWVALHNMGIISQKPIK